MICSLHSFYKCTIIFIEGPTAFLRLVETNDSLKFLFNKKILENHDICNDAIFLDTARHCNLTFDFIKQSDI